MRLAQVVQTRRDQIISLLPGGRLQFVALADQRRAQAPRAIDIVKAPAATVAQPAVVNLVVLARTQAHDFIDAHIDARVTANAAVRADTRHAFEFPGTSLETIGCGRERAHRADLHGIAREDRVEGVIGGRADLHAETTRDHYQAIIHRDLG